MTDLIHNCDDAALLAESNGCSVYQFRNETGEGVMTVYEVFQGVTLSYNDFHMQYYDSVFRPGKRCSASTNAGRDGWNIPQKITPTPMWRQEI